MALNVKPDRLTMVKAIYADAIPSGPLAVIETHDLECDECNGAISASGRDAARRLLVVPMAELREIAETLLAIADEADKAVRS